MNEAKRNAINEPYVTDVPSVVLLIDARDTLIEMSIGT